MYRQLHFIMALVIAGTYISRGQSTDSLIKNVRVKYESIRDNLKTYDTIARETWDESTEGGQITGYYKNKDLRFIETVYFGETGKIEIEYYFDDKKLFFVFEKRYAYNRPIYWDEKQAQENNDTVTYDPLKTITTSERYYFHTEKLIRWLDDKGKEVNLSLGTNELVGQSLVAHAYKLRDKLKN